MDPELTTVQIFGQEYAVRGGSDPEYVRKVAAVVDEQMRVVARESHQVSSVRIAILAAMNLADELLRERNGEGTARTLHARARRLAQSLEQALQASDGDGKGGEELRDA